MSKCCQWCAVTPPSGRSDGGEDLGPQDLEAGVTEDLVVRVEDYLEGLLLDWQRPIMAAFLERVDAQAEAVLMTSTPHRNGRRFLLDAWQEANLP